MAQSIRPQYAFVLRLWQEPGAHGGDSGWRGSLRVLDTHAQRVEEMPFVGLENLLTALQQLLDSLEQAR